jgi:ABC-2 type transport system ATP-binding protein
MGFGMIASPSVDGPVLEVRGLGRTFTTGQGVVRALEDVDLTIGSGEIVGLLGLNGAGKTTMLKVISTLLLPTSGTVRIAGVDVVRDTRRARRLVSVVLGGERGFYNRLSARDNIRFFATLSGLARRTLNARCDDALERVGLAEAAGRRVETFSKGMKQRLHLAVGMLTTPRLLMLDEPTVGLDPIEARRLRDAVAELRGTETAVLLTSHYLGDIERLASRVVILQLGRVTDDLPLEQLLERAGSVAEVAVTGVGPTPDLEALEAADLVAAGVSLLGIRQTAEPGVWRVSFEVKSWTPDSLRALAAAWPRSEIVDVHVQPNSLEQVFAELAAARRA